MPLASQQRSAAAQSATVTSERFITFPVGAVGDSCGLRALESRHPESDRDSETESVTVTDTESVTHKSEHWPAAAQHEALPRPSTHDG